MLATPAVLRMRGPDMTKPKLTERQAQVLLLVAEGLSDHAMGTRLHVSQHTVKTHVTHLLKRFSAKNRTHLVHIAHRIGLLGTPDPDPALSDPVWWDINAATRRVFELVNSELGIEGRAAFERCRVQVVAELARHALIRVDELDREAAA